MPTMPQPSPVLGNGVTAWLEGGNHEVATGPGSIHRAQKESMALGLHSHFLTCWELLGGIKVLHLLISVQGIPWLFLGLSQRGKRRRMPLGFHSCSWALEEGMEKPQEYFEDIFWSPSELRNEQKASAAV